MTEQKFTNIVVRNINCPQTLHPRQRPTVVVHYTTGDPAQPEKSFSLTTQVPASPGARNFVSDQNIPIGQQFWAVITFPVGVPAKTSNRAITVAALNNNTIDLVTDCGVVAGHINPLGGAIGEIIDAIIGQMGGCVSVEVRKPIVVEEKEGKREC